MEKLFTLGNTPEFITLLDNTVRALHMANNAVDFKKASMILSKFKEHPTMYRRVPFILEKTQLMQTRFIACQVMDIAIQQRWNAMPDAEKGGIKNYLVNKIISLTSNEASLRQHKALIGKMNHALVAILKFDWPAKWPTFVPEMVNSAKGNEILCENNVNILQLLGEEVFDFSRDQMTSTKTLAMKEQLKNEVGRIFELLIHVLRHSKRVSLIIASLKTLQKFIPWIPLQFVFETDLMKLLIQKFFRVQAFQRDTLACLTEIVGLQSPVVKQKYLNQIRTLFVVTMTELSKILPSSTNIAHAVESGSEDHRMFVRGLSLFCTTYLSNHLSVSEGMERPIGTVTCRDATLLSMKYVVRITEVDDKEIFKICIEFWHGITKSLYDEKCRGGGLKQGMDSNAFGASTSLNVLGKTDSSSQRIDMYENQVLNVLRPVMVMRMAKPEEVLIEQDERGEIVRQATKDTDAIAVYKTMRETIVYLTHLNYETTEDIMIDKLSKQVSGLEWSWNNLNRLCWAIGSISGTMAEDAEKRFLVTVIKDLLGLCEYKRGKDNKAVIASNIMYVVGQYPRFLKAHWRFLKTVVNKLFEFMHELHPGVQDMACDTFLKISKKCRKEFVALQQNESTPYIVELLRGMRGIISELEAHQVYVFYEAVGFMISAEKKEEKRKELLFNAMSLPNARWKALMHAASNNGGQSLKLLDSVKAVSEVLRTNISMCRAMGYAYLPYLTTIYREMLNVCKLYSEHVKMCVAKFGRNALSEPQVRFMRVAKKEALQLIELFIKKSKASHASFVAEMCLPPLLDPVLADYHASIPMARDSHVLSLMATMVNKLKEHMAPHVPVVMKSTFLVTFDMLKGNFTDFPDIRHAFFRLLHAIVTHCFSSIFQTPPEYRVAVVSCILGAMRHTERIAAEMGLDILHKFLEHVQSDNNTAQMFYKAFFMNILRDVLVILTDRHHKSGFGKQAVVLKYMFSLVENGRIQVPLGGEGSNNNSPGNNKQVVVNFVLNMISNLFPKMSKVEIQKFVSGSFDQSKSLNEFKQHLHDFLVHTKEWSGDRDNAAMFFDEQQAIKKREMAMKSRVPGLIAPYELDDDDDV